MRVGICISPEELFQAQAVGFDFAEYALSALAHLNDSDFFTVLSDARRAILPVRVCGGRLTADIVHTPAFPRAKALGADVLRLAVPPALWSPEALVRLNDHCARYGLTAALQPVSAEGQCTVRLFERAASFLRAMGCPRLGLSCPVAILSSLPFPTPDTVRLLRLIRLHADEDAAALSETLARLPLPDAPYSVVLSGRAPRSPAAVDALRTLQRASMTA